MRELRSAGVLGAACGGDSICLWTAQGLDGRARAWAAGGPGEGGPGEGGPGEDGPDRAAAVAVACPGLSRHDRIAVWGRPEPAARLVAGALRLAGPSFRPLGDPELIAQICLRVPDLELTATFGWMDTPPGLDMAGDPGPAGPPPGLDPAPGPGSRGGFAAARWLEPGEMTEVAGLLDRVFPDSYARPGLPGVHRWAGIRDAGGRLAAVAADAWSAPAVGFMAGVAVAAEHRRAGLGTRICRFVLAGLLARHGRAALMVDDWNGPAIAVYRRLGLSLSPVAVARVMRA